VCVLGSVSQITVAVARGAKIESCVRYRSHKAVERDRQGRTCNLTSHPTNVPGCFMRSLPYRIWLSESGPFPRSLSHKLDAQCTFGAA